MTDPNTVNLAVLMLQLDNAILGLRMFARGLVAQNLPRVAAQFDIAADAFEKGKRMLGALPSLPQEDKP